jgi:HD-GYP domain-containing protein (c-di-GMP phosphodiesterase class II)
MTEHSDSARLPSDSFTDARRDSEEVAIRQGGREFLLAFYACLKNLRLYPVENVQVQRALDDVHATAAALLEIEPEMEVKLAGEFIFVNSTRLRIGLDNYSSFSHILSTLSQCGIGSLYVGDEVERREWQVFLSLILAFAPREADPNKLNDLQRRLVEGGVTHMSVEPPIESEEYADAEEAKEVAKRTYEQSVAVTKDVVNSIRMGRTASIKKVKRAVQGVVDQVLRNETSMIGLTTIRDYDEYTFVHSVNVTIFSVSIGKRLGLTKLQLYDLGMAALMHDVGKSRVPIEVLNKKGALNDEEWQIMQSHPWMGMLTLFGLRGYGEIPYRGIIVAHEHHMKIDLTGYPKAVRKRTPSLYTKIVAIADGFDAATSRRVYQENPIQPDQVLREMWENRRRGLDPALVKAFINLLGIYPVGTCVILDTYEVAIVHAANPKLELSNRPLVRVLCTPDGATLDQGPIVDLAETGPDGSLVRSIIKVTNPAKYGINPSDYFV